MSDYIIHRNKLTAMFDLHVKNAEELDRTTSPKLLPSATSPRLTGPEGKGPWLSVVGHDPETFAMQSLEGMGTPLSLSNKFTNACVITPIFLCEEVRADCVSTDIGQNTIKN